MVTQAQQLGSDAIVSTGYHLNGYRNDGLRNPYRIRNATVNPITSLCHD